MIPYFILLGAMIPDKQWLYKETKTGANLGPLAL